MMGLLESMKSIFLSLMSPLLCFSPAACTQAAPSSVQPVEIGNVRWGRDVDVGLTEAKESGKPVFLLFQEVPGCSGCQQFGREVLSDPTMVKAIETHFVPIFVANNQGGKDAETLKRFQEPAWNYQVVRFLNAEEQDLVPRKDGVWTVQPLAKRMLEALRKTKVTPSEELRRLAGENVTGMIPTQPAREKAAFAQYCFWTGEMRLGQIVGVVKTEAGFFEGREVTLVEYDPSRVTFDRLVRQATQAECADRVYVTTQQQADLAKAAGHRGVGELGASYRRAPVSDQKKQLQGTALAGKPMTEEQATKVNAFVRVQPEKALEYLKH